MIVALPVPELEDKIFAVLVEASNSLLVELTSLFASSKYSVYTPTSVPEIVRTFSSSPIVAVNDADIVDPVYSYS